MTASRDRSALLLVAVAAATMVAVSALPPVPARAGVDPPGNVACLPFPQPDIVSFNGGGDALDDLSDPYVATPDRATLTWKDAGDDSITGYRVERSENGGPWEVAADDLPPETRFHTDTDLDPGSVYRYRVRQLFGAANGDASPVCQKPLFTETEKFILFYRTTDCPPVDDAEDQGRQVCVDPLTPPFIMDSLEGARQSLVGLGFADPVPGQVAVDLFPCDGAGCARSEDGTSFIALSPASMEPTYDAATQTGQASVKVPMHELFHRVEGRYGCCSTDPTQAWINEGTARSMEDKICVALAEPCVSLDQAQGTAYVDEVQRYLIDPNQTLTEASYRAALFWTYLLERFGTTTDEPQRGIDFLLRFFERLEAEQQDGIDTITGTMIDEYGIPGGFAAAFMDFAVANYAKDLADAPSAYRYIDEGQAPGSYGTLEDLDALTEDFFLAPDTQAVGQADIAPWGARYFRAAPIHAEVENIEIVFDQQLSNDLYYHVLPIEGSAIVDDVSSVGPDLEVSLPNEGYDEVVVVVAGLENGGIVNYSINGQDPQVVIVDPLESRPAQAGDPAAPGKILVKVQVLAPEDGSPIAGIDPAEGFEIQIGPQTLDLTDPQVLIADAFVQGEYWLVLRAPVQSAEDSYTLRVAYGAFDDVEFDAVQYAAVPESDNVLVIDRSGSMGGFEKLDAAQDAGRLYVDTWDFGDQIGVVSFASVEGEDDATLDLPLTAWNDGVIRDLAFGAIDDLQANGSTAIGAGLLEGLAAFDGSGDPDHVWAQVLLTDGLDNTEPMIETFQEDYDARVAAGTQVPAVHAVGLGPDADLEKLQQLAAATKGTFQYASQVPPEEGLAEGAAGGPAMFSELAEIDRVVAEITGGEQQVYAATRVGPWSTGFDTHEIVVDSAAVEATFSVNWYPPELPGLQIQVQRPDGVEVDPTLVDGTHHVYKVADPMPGTWTVTLFTTSVDQASYLVEASVRSDVTLFGALGLPLDERKVGRPMPILASLSEAAGIPGADVQAMVTDPGGTEHLLVLHDDGQHGDGAAGDGFYGGTFLSTFLPGAYVVVVDAAGTAPLAGPFERRFRLSFVMEGGLDLDGDGIPDWWEDEQGTDPTRPDGSRDPDGDGCSNRQEHRNATHPLDADTDEGGEHDCSEALAALDPRDPDDDRAEQPRAAAWAGVDRVSVTYHTRARRAAAVVERSTRPGGPFREIGRAMGPGPFVDTQVRRGKTYCYRVLAALGTGVESAPSTVECATPRLDPDPPTGEVAIDGDAMSTGSRRVLLTLRATDHPETAEFPLPFLDPAAVPSGVVEMRIWNPGREAAAVWEPFASTRRWTLAPTGRSATVLARFRDAAGNVSDVALDTIRVQR